MTSEKVYNSVLTEENGDLPIKEPEPEPQIRLGVRHLQALLLFLSLAVGYSMRAQLSVCIVVMTSDTNEACRQLVNGSDLENRTLHGGGGAEYYCEDHPGWSVYRTYNWSKAVQEMIMFSFFVGYTTMQVPMGIIAQKFGGKITVMVALAVNGVLSILTPWVPLMGGWVGVCVCRLVQGLTQAAYFPSIHTLLGKWAPMRERGRLSTYIYTGSPFGTIIGFQMAGYFAGSKSLGWPATFWFCGTASLVCFALIAWYGASSPDQHPSISAEEVQYITSSGTADAQSTRFLPSIAVINPQKRKTPWRAIFSSKAVWGMFCVHMGSGFGYILVLTQIPLYMSHVLGVNIKNNGLFSSLPYIAMYLLTLLFGYLSDLMINKKIMSIKNVRRTFNTIGTTVSVVFLVAFSFVQNTGAAVTLLVLAISLHAGVHVGFNLNQIDLAPNFAGTLMSIGNMLCNLGILLCPVFVSNIIKDDMTNQSRWQIVFIVTALIQASTNTVYLIFIKGEVQSWNYAETDDAYEEVSVVESKEDNTIVLKEKQ